MEPTEKRAQNIYPMKTFDHSILDHLAAVQRERERRFASPDLEAGVQAVKAHQHKRFEETYADLLRSGRYGPAARFFLDELYGPMDFARRDQQFARVVHALVQLFGAEILETAEALASLHALSEELDSQMGAHFALGSGGARSYREAWHRTGRAGDRERQIELMLLVGAKLDTLTRKPLLRISLNMMRVPARAAGLAELQKTLERGFEAFRSMNGAAEFLVTIGQRERTICLNLFSIS